MPVWTSLPMDAVPIQDFTQPPYRTDHLWYSHSTGLVYYVTKMGTCYVFAMPLPDLTALSKAYKRAYPTEDQEYERWLKMF